MIADAIRKYYNYHFSENRKLWDEYVTDLSLEQFNQEIDYSHGSVRNQIIHLMNVDDTWFSELRGVEPPEPYNTGTSDDRKMIREHWDTVEQNMRGYLARLQDDMLFEKPLPGEDKDLFVWQVFLHVVNHGTDHRAQLLRIFHDFGIKTGPQDYIFFAYENL